MTPDSDDKNFDEDKLVESSLESNPTTVSYIQPEPKMTKVQAIKAIGLNTNTLRLGIAAFAFVLLVSAGTVILNSFHSKSSSTNVGSSFLSSNLPLQNLQTLIPSNNSIQKLQINGDLQVQNSLIVNPSNLPSNPTKGQIYFDSLTNKFEYFNGSIWQNLGGNKGSNIVCSVGNGNLSGGGNTINTTVGGSCNGLSLVNSPTIGGSLTIQGASGLVVGSTTNAGIISLLDGTNDGYSAKIEVSGTLNSNSIFSLPSEGGTICLENSPSCGFSLGNNAFLQGGNSFGSPAILGTNDNNSLSFETNGVSHLSIDALGNVTLENPSGSSSLLTAAGQLTIDSGASSPLNIGTSNANGINVGSSSNSIKTTVNGTFEVKPASGSDSTNLVQFQNTLGTSFFTADSTNLRLYNHI